MHTMKKSISIVSSIILICFGFSELQAKTPQNYPEFSWDQVPLYMHMRKSLAFTPEELTYIATFPIVTLEKTTGSKTYGSTEKGSLEAAKAIKALNPKTKILYYRNIMVHYGGYDVNESMDAIDNPLLMNSKGETKLIHGKKRGAYDLSNPALRQWWIDDCVKMGRSEGIDGLFIDGNIKALEPAFLSGIIGNEKKEKVAIGYGQTMKELDERLGDDKIIVANLIRARLTNSGLDYINYVDGSYIEGFEHEANGYSKKDYVARGIEAIQTAARDGKIICFSIGLGEANTVGLGIDDTRKKVGNVSLLQERLNYTLSMFLIFAEKYSYFYAHDGYSVNGHDSSVWLKSFPEYKKPLGAPKGPAQKEGYIYTREFQHASVWLDIENEKAKIEWR